MALSENDVKRPTHSPEFVREVSEKVYRLALAQTCGGNDAAWRSAAADRMIAKDGDGGAKFSGRAGAYDKLTRIYLEVLEVKP